MQKKTRDRVKPIGVLVSLNYADGLLRTRFQLKGALAPKDKCCFTHEVYRKKPEFVVCLLLQRPPLIYTA